MTSGPFGVSKEGSTLDQILNITAVQLGISLEEVRPDSSFVDDLGADSLDTIEMVMAVEEHFEIEISDDEAEKINTPQQTADFIKAFYPQLFVAHEPA